jgi:hypothetical protein
LRKGRLLVRTQIAEAGHYVCARPVLRQAHFEPPFHFETFKFELEVVPVRDLRKVGTWNVMIELRQAETARQVTDRYLLGLARRFGGRVVTCDTGWSSQAARCHQLARSVAGELIAARAQWC